MRLLFVDRSTKLKTVTDLARQARGGMVASLFQVTDALVSQGCDVTVLSDIESAGVTRAGAKWLQEAWGTYDCLILNRGIGDGYPDIHAKHRILWTHDLPHAGFVPDPRTLKAIDCTVFMSGYAEQLWRAYYPDIGHSVRITNGVDRKIFYPRQKDMRYLIYASAPNRGLDKLPLIVSAVREKVPVHMKAFSRLSALHPNEGNDEFDYASIQAEGLERCDPVPQEVLADELGKASAMILPTGYPEICSNVVLQSLASGTPVITTGGLGATPEWVRHGKNGMLTGFLPHDYMIHSLEMVRNTVSVLEDEKLHKRLIQGALQTRIPTWGEIGRKWLTLLHRYC